MTIHTYTYTEVITRQRYRLLRKDRVRKDNENHHTTSLAFFHKAPETVIYPKVDEAQSTATKKEVRSKGQVVS